VGEKRLLQQPPFPAAAMVASQRQWLRPPSISRLLLISHQQHRNLGHDAASDHVFKGFQQFGDGGRDLHDTNNRGVHSPHGHERGEVVC